MLGDVIGAEKRPASNSVAQGKADPISGEIDPFSGVSRVAHRRNPPEFKGSRLFEGIYEGQPPLSPGEPACVAFDQFGLIVPEELPNSFGDVGVNPLRHFYHCGSVPEARSSQRVNDHSFAFKGQGPSAPDAKAGSEFLQPDPPS